MTTACAGVSTYSCGAISGWITSLLSIALASVVFLFWRFWRMDRRYRARGSGSTLVNWCLMACLIFGKIVGRDDLCRVLMEDLRDRGSRLLIPLAAWAPEKTAVMVLLTEMLAKRRAIPVPIRLRDAKTLDFSALAKVQFMENVNERLTSAEKERRSGDGCSRMAASSYSLMGWKKP